MTFNNNDVAQLLYVPQNVLCKFPTGEINVIPRKLWNELREVHLNDHKALHTL